MHADLNNVIGCSGQLPDCAAPLSAKPPQSETAPLLGDTEKSRFTDYLPQAQVEIIVIEIC